jgi:pyruvate kinase
LAQKIKANFPDSAEVEKIELNIGDKFALDADMGETSGNQDGVGIAYKTLPQEVKVNTHNIHACF